MRGEMGDWASSGVTSKAARASQVSCFLRIRGCFCDASYGGGAVKRSVEVTEPFFEADGVEGIEVSQGVHALCFLFHAVGYHWRTRALMRSKS